MHLVLEELETFNQEKQRSVTLLFPPLPNRLRFLIHRTVEDMLHLSSFSVGESWCRRVVVCFSEIRGEVKGESDVDGSGLHENTKESRTSKPKPLSKRKKRTPRRPDQALYLPRAVRERLSEQRGGTDDHKDIHPKYEEAGDRGGVEEGCGGVEEGCGGVEDCGGVKEEHGGVEEGCGGGEEEHGGVEDCGGVEEGRGGVKEGCGGGEEEHGGVEEGCGGGEEEHGGVEEGCGGGEEEHGGVEDCGGVEEGRGGVKEGCGGVEEHRVSLKELEEMVTDVEELNVTEGAVNGPKAEVSEGDICNTTEPKQEETLGVSKRPNGDTENTDSETEELAEEIRPHLKPGVSFCIDEAHGDFSAFVSASLSSGEFSHVIEIYDFPALFKTEDLMDAFSDYSDGGMKVVWVDSTHALGVFCGEAAALQVLSMSHPLLKTRPLGSASRKAQSKAVQRAEFLQPVKERPRTDSAVARRMVTRALGLQAPRGKR